MADFRVTVEDMRRAFLALTPADRAEFAAFAVRTVRDDDARSPTTFADLFDDVYARILSHLRPWQMARACSTCRALRNALADAIMLRGARMNLLLGDARTLNNLVLHELQLAQELSDAQSYSTLACLVAHEVTANLHTERAWARPPLPPFHSEQRGVRQQWEHEVGQGALVLTRHGQTSISWAEGGSALHTFPLPLRPTVIAVSLRADGPRRAVTEGPGICLFASEHDARGLATGISAPFGFVSVHLHRDGSVCVEDRHARRLHAPAPPSHQTGAQGLGALTFGDEPISARHPALFPRVLHAPWHLDVWYRVTLSLDWGCHRASCAVEAVDLPPGVPPPPRKVVDELFLPTQPLAGLCCYWGQGSSDAPSASVRWRDFVVSM